MELGAGADDTANCSIPHALQALIHVCEYYAKDDCIVFNSSKSNIMCIKPLNMKYLKVPDIFVCGQPVTMKETCQYLGVLLSHDLSDDNRELSGIYSRGKPL